MKILLPQYTNDLLLVKRTKVKNTSTHILIPVSYTHLDVYKRQRDYFVVTGNLYIVNGFPFGLRIGLMDMDLY